MDGPSVDIMDQDKKRIILAVLAGLLAATGLLAWRYTRSPKFALVRVYQAVCQRDMVRLERHVDIKGVLDKLIDGFVEVAMAEAQRDQAASRNPMGMQLGAMLGQGVAGMLKPMLIRTAEGKIEHFIETEKVPEPPGLSGILGLVLALEGRAPVPLGDGFEFLGAHVIGTSGKMAILGLKFHINQLDKTVVLKLRMRRHAGSWQVAEVMNLWDLALQLDAAEKLRVEELNKPVRQAMTAALRIKDFEKTVPEKGGKGFMSRTVFTLQLWNTGGKPISRVEGKILIKDLAGNAMAEFPVSRTVAIPPGAAVPIQKKKDLFRMLPLQAALLDMPRERLNASLTVTRIVFADGSELKLHRMEFGKKDLVDKVMKGGKPSKGAGNLFP